MTDSSNRYAKVTVGYEVDQSSVSEVTRSVDQIRAELNSVADANAAIGSSAVDAGSKITSSFGGADLQAINDIRDALGEVADQGERASGIDLSSLSRGAGRALNQLGLQGVGRPLQQLGDVGIIAKDIGKVSDAFGLVDTSAIEVAASMGLAGAAIGAVVIAADLFSKQFDGLQSAFDEGLSAFDKFYAALDAKTTTAEAKQAISDAQGRLKNDNQELSDAQAAYNKGRYGSSTGNSAANSAQLGQTLAGGPVNALLAFIQNPQAITQQITGALGGSTPILGESLGKLEKTFDAAKKAVDGDNATIQANTQLLNQGKTATADTGEFYAKTLPGLLKSGLDIGTTAAKALTDAQKQQAAAQIQSAQDSAKIQADINKEIASDTYAQAKTRLDAISQEEASNLQLIANLKALPDPTGQAATVIAQLTEKNKGLVNEGTQLLGALDSLPAELAARDQRLAQDQSKYNDATLAADNKLAEDRAAISKKLNDTLVADAQKLADTLASDLTNLTQKQEDLTTGLGRDLSAEQVDEQNKALTIQINAGRKTLQLAQEHAAAMQQIRDDADAKETQDLLDRNFLGLLKDRLQTTTDLTKENTSFNSKTAQQQTDEQNQLSDLTRSSQQQRDARLLAYQQANEDAQKQYQRANAAAEAARKLADDRAKVARDQSLIDLNNQFVKEKGVRDANYIQQLKDDAFYGQQRINLNAKVQAGLVAQAQSALNALSGAEEMSHGASSGGSEVAHRADGGSAIPGNAYLVNDKFPGQRESVNGVPLPSNALGYYIPLQPGYVSSGASGGSTNLTINATFTGITKQEAAMQTVQLIGQVIGKPQ